jgi:CO/xanthine dehydrogenase FAD-binding subunit
MTRLENLIHNPLVYVPLKTAIEEMASPAIRHVATIGGNIGNASPAGDTLTILYVYNTIVVLESVDGLRKVPIDEYIIGPGQTTKRDNELIKEIIMKDVDYKGFYYEKVGGRRSDAISKLSFIGLYSRDEQGIINDIRIAFGSVFKTVVRSRTLEKKLIKAVNEEEAKLLKNERLSRIIDLISEYSIQTVIDKYDKRIVPIDDQRSNAKYRKACSISLLKSFLNMIGGD